MRRLALFLGALSSLTLVSSAVLAQPRESKATADALFEAGKRLLAQGKIEQACAKFEESERLDHALGTMLNIADCYETAGRTASAWATFREVATIAQRERDSRATYAKSRAAKLTKRLSDMVIAVGPGANVPGLTVRRDDVVVGSAQWGEATPVDPGPHKIEVSAPGRRTWSTTANVEPNGSHSTVTVPALEPEAAPPPALNVEVEQRAATQRMAGMIVGGVGVAGLAVGTVFGLIAANRNAEADELCASGRCGEAGAELSRDALGAATVSTVLFVVGAVAIGGGAALYFTAPKSNALRVAPTFGPRTAGLAIGGAW